MTCAQCKKNKETPCRKGKWCLECKKQYDREWYERNKLRLRDSKNAANKKHRASRSREVKDYLLTHPCVDCGEGHLDVLDFDHITGEKMAHVADLISSGSRKSLWEEIAKCEVRCANCHRKVTAKRRRNECEEDGNPVVLEATETRFDSGAFD